MQQVNLYSLLPKRVQIFLTLRVMLKIAAILGVLLVLVTVVSLVMNLIEYRQFSSLKSQEVLATQKLADLKKRYPYATDIVNLEAQLPVMRKELEYKIGVLAPFTAKFSNYLTGLANLDISGAWLRNISVTNGGLKIALTGSAIRPTLVQQMLAKINTEPNFAGRRFSLTEMTNAPAAEGEKALPQTNFILATKTIEVGGLSLDQPK